MKKSVLFYIIIASICFGTIEVALKLSGGAFDALQNTFYRFLLSGIFLLIPAYFERRGKGKIALKDLLYIAFLGILNVDVSMIIFQLGIIHLNAATSAVIFSCNPIFTILFAHFLVSGDRINRKKIAAIIFAIIGIFFMVRPWDMQAGNSFIGVAFILTSAALFALYGVLGKRTINRVGIYTQTSISFLVGTALLPIYLFFTHTSLEIDFAKGWPFLIYIGIFATGVGYLTWFLAIKHSKPSTASLVFFFKPVIAPIVAYLVLGESIPYNIFIGIGFILVGSGILLYRQSR